MLSNLPVIKRVVTQMTTCVRSASFSVGSATPPIPVELELAPELGRLMSPV